MKICMFTNTYLPHVGGVARSVAAFAEDLRRRNHQVLVVAPTFPGTEQSAENEEQVVRVPAIQNFNGSDFSVRILLPGQFSQQLDRFAPDIIHSHHPFLLGDAALRTARHRGLPIVFTHHTLYERYTHYVPFDSPPLKHFVVDLATRFANLCRMVIAPSESIAELLDKRGVVVPCRVVPTGVDTEFFSQGRGDRFRQNHGIDPDAHVIGHLGRLAPEKNLGYLAEAVGKVLCDMEKGVFLVAGKGPSTADIEKIFSNLGIAEKLVLAGQVQGDDLRDCYAAMDLFVFASTSETQGMVLTEAMAAGLPVVALDAPGAREVVNDGSNGRLLAEDCSTTAFAEAVAAAAKEDALERWRSQALQTAEAFSRQASATKLEEVYQEVLATERRPAVPGLDAWDGLLETLRAEWELAASKFSAAVEAVGHWSDTPRGPE